MSIVVVNTPDSSTTVSNIASKNIQQAAIDIILENVWSMSGDFRLDEDTKTMRNTVQLIPDKDDYYHLPIGSYEVSFNHDIHIGPNEAALVITRSTLVRNGLQCTSGLWDPKFQGRGGCCLHISGGPAIIKRGTRIAQFVVWKVLNPQGEYSGSYGLSADGLPKNLEAKYYPQTPI